MAQPANNQERADVEALIPAMGPGHFTAERVRLVHAGLMANTGRDPMSPIRLGQVLGEMGVISKQRWDKSKGYMVKGWIF
jgi:hypothetical protein